MRSNNQTLPMRHAGDDCISKPVILKLMAVRGHTGLRASVSRGSGVLLPPRPWSVRDGGTFFLAVSNSVAAIIYKDSSNRKVKGHLHPGLAKGASLPATPDSHHTDAGLRKWRRRSVTSCCRISLSQNTFMASGWIQEKKTKG